MMREKKIKVTWNIHPRNERLLGLRFYESFNRKFKPSKKLFDYCAGMCEILEEIKVESSWVRYDGYFIVFVREKD